MPVQRCTLPLTPSSAVVKKEYSYTSTPPMVPYGLYRASVPVQRCTLPSSLLVLWSRKSIATPLLPLWAVRPVQSLSACTRVHFTVTYTSTPPVGRTTCTEPQCLYNGALYLTLPYSSLNHVIYNPRHESLSNYDRA